MQAYVNTIVRTLAGTLLILGFTVLAAYPLSKRDLPYRNTITIFFLIAMFFSGGIIPDYLLVKNLGLLDTRWALVLPSAVNVFYIIIMRNYFMTIDKGIEESAVVDGASYFTILTKIIMPLSKPVLATIALWAAVYHWNEWFHAMVYIQDSSKTVLQIIVRDMLTALDLSQSSNAGAIGGGGGATENLLLSNVRASTVIISIGPIVMVYPYVQKYFIKGIMIGSLKG
ncbi:carbohydrate ABC transporter permease [Paenibacillus chungangensis]|uniref:Carbohydrate ABC transporter permease n=1 Tax=Paenibacillus chungangensis TaxID=696535 RepID=A0ABW3HUZ6_9BACL